jgi:hypothetical protein
MASMNAETLASLTTAAGTLVLAVATFSSTRSANNASRTAERALLAGLRPVLMHARLDDPRQKVGFMDQHWLHLDGAGGAIEVTDDAIYLAAAVRNVGTGIAILQGWHTYGERTTGTQSHANLEEFTMLTPRHLHPRRRPRILAGRAPRPRKPDLRTGRRRGAGPPPDRLRHPLQRPTRLATDDHPTVTLPDH